MPSDAATPTASLGRAQYLALTAAFLGWMFDGLEMGLFPLVARPALLELLGPEAKGDVGSWTGWITAAFLVGAAAGGILFGWLGDRIGRVRAMVWSVLTYAIFSGLCGFAESPAQIFVLRLIAALGMGGEWSLGVALVMEIWPSKSRPMLAGLIGAASNVGFLLIAVAGLAMNRFIDATGDGLRSLGISEESVVRLLGEDQSGWRLLMFLGATPALLTFFVRLFVPESERWKHAASTAPPARVRDIFARDIVKKTILGTSLAGLALLGTWGSIQFTPSWARKMAEGTDSVAVAPAYTQICSGIGAVIGTLAAAYFAEWFSRRKSYFLMCVGSLVVCAYLFRTPMQFDGHFLLFIGLAGGLTASFYGWLPLYLPELFPTRIRATGQGFAFNFGRVLAAAGSLGSAGLLKLFEDDYARMCSIISLVYLAGMVLIWFCPETKGQPLPE
jgi:SHS family sialic acid transporter-like MFS transporter